MSHMPQLATEKRALIEIAAALGISKRGVERRATRECWIFDEVPGIGGKRRLYPLAALPKEIVNALHVSEMQSPEITPGVSKSRAVADNGDVASFSEDMTTHQLDVELARDRIFQFTEGYQGGVKAALTWLNDEKFTGSLTGPLLWAYEHAWDKPRAANRLTPKTYYNWLSAKSQRGRAAPKKVQPDMTIKPWHSLAVELKQRPQGSLLVWIAEEIARQWNPAWGDTPPTKRAVGYFFAEKFSALDQLKGRHTGSALSPHVVYTKRSTSGMQPWDEIHADGWNTHFTAPHPVSGEFVTYEVWHAHDVATRYVPPFSIGLTENFEVIAKCFENIIRCGGVPAIVQTDSTAIVKKSERLKTNPATSLADRAGFTIVHPVKVGNSQANGIAENFNTYLDRCSRELATYQAKDMDALTLKRVKKLTAKMVAATAKGESGERARLRLEAQRMGKGKVFDSYAEAVAWLEDKRQKFNSNPHSSLEKIRDSETGRMRRQSPNEAIAAHRAAGWEPVMLDEYHLVDMFWQHVEKKVSRQTVRPYGGMRFYDPALAEWEGKMVIVAFDENDHSRVWIKKHSGEIICEAIPAPESEMRGQTAVDAALEKRALQQIARLDKKVESVRAKVPGLVIENEGELRDEPRQLSVADFVDVDAKPVEEKLLKMTDFLPTTEAAPEMKSREELNAWLYGDASDDDAQKSAAA
jgi:putative transposase